METLNVDLEITQVSSWRNQHLINKSAILIDVFVFHGWGSWANFILNIFPNGTREKWVACGMRGKNSEFWPFICCSYKVISTIEIEPVFPSPKNACQFNWIWHWKCICKFTKTLGLLISTDFRYRQYVQPQRNLEKQKELIKIFVPHPKAAVCCLLSCDLWTKSLFIHSASIMSEHNIFESWGELNG